MKNNLNKNRNSLNKGKMSSFIILLYCRRNV